MPSSGQPKLCLRLPIEQHELVKAMAARLKVDPAFAGVLAALLVDAQPTPVAPAAAPTAAPVDYHLSGRVAIVERETERLASLTARLELEFRTLRAKNFRFS
jgi:hypothetical protein